ncbi:MAG: alginate lyase family protein [Lentisphaeria bacterium]|nr:alginate lyase family protein [Lentisphaeria bacterium]
MKKLLLLFLTGVFFITAATADELDSPILKEEWRNLVLNEINWDYPGLEQGKKLFLAGDKKGASAAFVAHLRNKKQPQNMLDRLNAVGTGKADEGANYIWRYGANSHKFPNRRIDWFYNKTKDIPGMFDREWQSQLNRMNWFADMARAYQRTGKKKYVNAFVRQLRNWVLDCPPPPEDKSGNYENSAWRNIDMGLRLGSYWAPAYVGFIKAPEFTDDDVMMYCYISLVHSRRLHRFNSYGNIFIMEMNGLYTFAAMFPEFKKAAANRKHAVDNVYKNTKQMFLPDGFLNELTNSYHRTVVGLMVQMFRLAGDCGFAGELPEDFTTQLERAYEAFAKLATPGLDMPMTNDSRHADVPKFFSGAVKLFPKRSDFLWFNSARKQGKAPEYCSVLMPWSGLVVMRESWEPNAAYLIFDIGPLGVRHAHQDKLNIAIWKGKDQLLYDDGGGSYARSRYRQYTVSSLAHNLVTVDGLGQATDSAPHSKFRKLAKPVSGDFKSDGKQDYARGVFDQGWGGRSGNKIVRQERQVVYIRPNIFIVLDRMIPTKRGAKKPHAYQARWHVDTLEMLPALPGHPALISTQKHSATARERIYANPKKRNRIIVAPLFTEGVSVEHQTGKVDGKWNELAGVYAIHPYRKTTTVTHSRKAARGEQRFLTMFMPLDAKAENPLKAIRQNGVDGAEVVFKDGSKVTVTIVNGKLSAQYQK